MQPLVRAAAVHVRRVSRVWCVVCADNAVSSLSCCCRRGRRQCSSDRAQCCMKPLRKASVTRTLTHVLTLDGNSAVTATACFCTSVINIYWQQSVVIWRVFRWQSVPSESRDESGKNVYKGNNLLIKILTKPLLLVPTFASFSIFLCNWKDPLAIVTGCWDWDTEDGDDVRVILCVQSLLGLWWAVPRAGEPAVQWTGQWPAEAGSECTSDTAAAFSAVSQVDVTTTFYEHGPRLTVLSQVAVMHCTPTTLHVHLLASHIAHWVYVKIT